MDDTTYEKSDIIIKPDGSRITRSSLLNDAIQFYQEKYQDRFSDICDFNEGSEIRTIHESFLVELFSLYKEMFRNAKQKFVLDSTGTYLDRLGCEYHLDRKTSKCATGSVTFSINDTFNKEVIIPKGTVILNRENGYEYQLNEDVTIRNAATPTNGTVTSVLAGAKYNARTGKLTAFQNVHAIHKTIKVINNSPITGGTDGETDTEFRARILNAKREKSWGTSSVYENDIIDNVFGDSYGVHDVQFVNPEILKANEKLPPHYIAGTDWESLLSKDFSVRQKYYCTDCTAVLFVNGNMKPCSDELLQAVEYYITQQNNLVISHEFHVQSASVNYVYFEMELFYDSVVSESEIYTHLNAFFDGGTVEGKSGTVTYEGLKINEGVSKNQLLDVLENIPGVHQVGSLHQMKYNPDLSLNDAWVDYHDNTYSYTDDEGYTYKRKLQSPDIIDHWGWKNFNKIECGIGQVLACGSKQNIDSSAETPFNLTYEIVSQ